MATMASTTIGGQRLKVNREKLAACMTCPICGKLFRDATTISECLHSFCRHCICEKITEEDLDSCPICNTDLGSAPLEKLRADHNLQELRFKIFPSKRQNLNAPEAKSSIQLPARRKERSLSSLVVSTPKSPAKSSFSGRRSNPGPKKKLALQEHTSPMEEYDRDMEDHQEGFSPGTLSITAQNKRQIHSAAETSGQHIPEPDKGNEDGAEPLKGIADLWKPLNVIVNAASKTKFNSRGTVGRPALLRACENKPLAKAKLKQCGNSSKVHHNEIEATSGPSGSVKPRKSLGRPRKVSVSEGLNVPAQTVVDTSSKYDGRFCPIWFSLVASENQKGDAPLPQISSCYLRVKDGSLPVSLIKKYLVKKLDLASEAEVEISLRGQPVLSTLQLHNLVTWWVQTTSASERIQTSVGSSAKDFVMVLSYGRKAQPQ